MNLQSVLLYELTDEKNSVLVGRLPDTKLSIAPFLSSALPRIFPSVTHDAIKESFSSFSQCVPGVIHGLYMVSCYPLVYLDTHLAGMLHAGFHGM